MAYYADINPRSYKKPIAAYYGGWTPLSSIHTELLDTVYFSFFLTNSSGHIYSSYSDEDIKNFIKLKNKNSFLKLVAAIGGWEAGTTEFSRMASSPEATKNFVQNVLDLTTKYGFDGIDIDWEYPVIGGKEGGETSPNDKRNFSNLLAKLSSKLSPKEKSLSIAVCADPGRSSQAYDIRLINEYEHNTPINKMTQSVLYWIREGCFAHKLSLGLAAYGYKYGNKRTAISYREILQEKGSWLEDDDDGIEPTGKSLDNAWITYDSPKSIVRKAGIVDTMGLKGCFFWSCGQDDYDTSRSVVKCPLMRAAHYSLKG